MLGPKHARGPRKAMGVITRRDLGYSWRTPGCGARASARDDRMGWQDQSKLADMVGRGRSLPLGRGRSLLLAFSCTRARCLAAHCACGFPTVVPSRLVCVT